MNLLLLCIVDHSSASGSVSLAKMMSECCQFSDSVPHVVVSAVTVCLMLLSVKRQCASCCCQCSDSVPHVVVSEATVCLMLLSVQ